MAWNEPGKGGKDPWKGRNTPDSEVQAFLDRLKGMFGGGRGGSPGSGGGLGLGGFGPLGWIALLLAVWLVFNCFQLIDERQRGVVLRFGQFSRIMQPGANFKWPWPIETVTKVEATQVKQVSDQVRVLTKDENVVQIDFNAQYRVGDARKLLFGSSDPEETLKQAAESAVREIMGSNEMDVILYERDQLTVQARDRLQELLALYNTGLLVTEFNLQDARPPQEVKEAFDDAISAREDKNRLENEARAYASKVVPEARGDAARVRAEAEGYKAATVARAEGDAQRFSLLAREYRKAPEVTRKRLYLETMQLVLANNPKVLSGNERNLLYLPLDRIVRGGEQGATTVTEPPLRLPAAAAALPDPEAAEGRPERPAGREEPRR